MKVSIDIGAQNISIVQGMQQGKKIIVKNTVKVKTPPFIIKDGEILNVELLYDVLKNALHNNKIKGTKVNININSTTIITRELVIPKTPKRQAIQIISNEMFQARNLTLPYVVDYIVTDVLKEKSITKHKVLAVAIPQSIVEGYIKLCQMLNFSKSNINLEFNCIYKTIAIQPAIASKDKPIIIASVGTNNGIFLIIEKGKIVYSKTIALNISKYLNLTSDKKTIDYTKVDLTTTVSENQKKLVESFVYDIAQEFSKMIQFQFSRSHFTTIDDIYLIGAITNAGGVEKRIANLLDTKIKTISKPYCIKTKLNFKYSQYVSTIGGLIDLH
ncbi:pilus assembly protein PilM [Paludicola sp. MB14-C6]|uniref:pilus assembly protein PilM n=1 Tax=Paludihabitans sp. MB14-C6 TaxID=3070656 RepID=UPI0027DDC5E6|nr:pilus assembly protein PilM [Paludicola sp. MB14-C6]WMJ22096.1 pilus assembly protein PilM [Paludicola sp. MB14-C6]